MKKLQLLLILVLVSCTYAFSQETKKMEVEYLDPPKPNTYPFSGAVRVDHMLYLSGQVGVDPKTGKLIEGGIEAESRQTLENIKAVLERHGSGMNKIIKCTVFLVDIKEWPLMNSVYKTYFPEHFPARSAMAGSGLALGARVEIECIAVVD